MKNSIVIIEDDNDDKYYDIILHDDKIKKNNKLENDTMYLIHNSEPKSNDPKIANFLNFCINNGLFDNTFYDYKNTFSIIATKLNMTFEILSPNGVDINKNTFITKFKNEFGYTGDIDQIYKCFDKTGKGAITWDEFQDFFYRLSNLLQFKN